MSASLLPPGSIHHADYRQPGSRPAVREDGSVRLMTWNIERGYKLDEVLTQLKAVDADIIALQEVDVGCDRSRGVDTGAHLAAALEMNYLFLCEFQELASALRSPEAAGGGVHGNAILSRFDFAKWSAVIHSHAPIDWDAPEGAQPHPLAAREPRRGRRATLAADIVLPTKRPVCSSSSSSSHQPSNAVDDCAAADGAGASNTVRVYSAHLEVFCGLLDRVWQLSEIFDDARAAQQAGQCQKAQQQQQQQQQQGGGGDSGSACVSGRPCCQAILGDLNTMAHGVARLSPHYACGPMRWRSLGLTEGEWLERHVLACLAPCPSNSKLSRLGLPTHVARAAVNPGFFCPFPAATTVTLDNPDYRILSLFGKSGPCLWRGMAGKLDWMLLRGPLRVLQKGTGNNDFNGSDHAWLYVDVLPPPVA